MKLDKRLAGLERRAIKQITQAVDYELSVMSSAEKKHWLALSDNGNDLPALTPCISSMLAKHGLVRIFDALKDRCFDL